MPNDPITPPPESNRARRRRIRAEQAAGITGADKAKRPDNQPLRRDHRPKPKPPPPKLQELNRAHARTRVGPPPKPAKPTIGRGHYVPAPRARDKVKSVRWQANALVNNPAVGASLLAGGAAAAAQSQKKNWSKKAQDRTDVATGAAIGAGTGEVARQQGFYATKRSAAKSRKTWSRKGDLGPYQGPHKQTLKNLEREAHAHASQGGKKPSARVKMQYFADHFPKNVPGAGARRLGNAISTPKAVAGTLAASSLAGGSLVALHQKKVNKSVDGDPFNINKTKNQRKAVNSAITGAGGTTAAAGLLGGGIPGYKSDSSTFNNVRHGPWDKRVGAAISSARGGIFGFRGDAHKGFLNRETAAAAKHSKSPQLGGAEAFARGAATGKLKPEKEIIRHMKVGRNISTGLLGAGAATTAYGIHRKKKEEVRKDKRRYKEYQDPNEKYGRLVGGGLAGAGLSYGTEKVTAKQGRKWAGRAGGNLDQAARIVPNIAGRTGSKPRLTDHHIMHEDPGLLWGKTGAENEAAGHFRGTAGQQGYFSHVYGKTAKTARSLRKPSLAVAGVGAAGLAIHADKKKKPVSKASGVMSDKELKTRKKIQGRLTQVTSTIGLSGLGTLGLAAAAKKNPKVLRTIQKVPKLEKVTPEKIKSHAQNTAIIGGGLSGVGGYNFASYTNAEAQKKKRMTPVKKNDELAPTYGDEGFAKAWEPVARDYTPEGARAKRNKRQAVGGIAGGSAGVLGGASLHQGYAAPKLAEGKKLGEKADKLRSTGASLSANKNIVAGNNYRAKADSLGAKGAKLTKLGTRGRRGAIALAGAGAVGIAGGTAAAVGRKSKSWESYSKSDGTSAFGIEH